MGAPRPHEVARVAAHFHRQFKEAFGLDRTTLWRLHHGQYVRVCGAGSWNDVLMPQGMFKAFEFRLMNGRPIVISDSSTIDVTEDERAFMASRGIRSGLMIPLIARGNLIGVATGASSKPGKCANETLIGMAGDLVKGFAPNMGKAWRYECGMEYFSDYGPGAKVRRGDMVKLLKITADYADAGRVAIIRLRHDQERFGFKTLYSYNKPGTPRMPSAGGGKSMAFAHKRLAAGHHFAGNVTGPTPNSHVADGGFKSFCLIPVSPAEFGYVLTLVDFHEYREWDPGVLVRRLQKDFTTGFDRVWGMDRPLPECKFIAV